MKDQLCWMCDQTKCSWRNHLKPVDGWTAIPSVTCDGMKSYCITECPLFHKWDRDTVAREKNDWGNLRDDIICLLPERERTLLEAKKAHCREKDLKCILGVKINHPRSIIYSALAKYYELLIKRGSNEYN